MKTNMRDRVVSLALLAGSVIIMLTVSGFSSGPSFIRSNNMKSEMTSMPVEQPVITVADTIPQNSQQAEREEIDWGKIKQEMEAALEEIKEIDWDEIKQEMEAARLEALEEIDWDEMRLEMKQNLSEIQIDIEEMKREIESSMNEIDWDEIREEMEKSRVFLDSLKIEMDH